jgi:ABC-type branched-subunit amino acid transport system ATPase component/ABC-type branched-subunit amino acid transport system permease subunit
MRDRGSAFRAVVLPALAVVAFALAGLAFDTYVQYVCCLCLVAILVGTALVPLVGYAKVVMLAGGAMMGIGAYTASLLVLDLHVPFLAAVVVAAAAGALAGFILGLPAVRFRGHHLAMVTLVFQSLGVIVLRESKALTGGAEGMRVAPAVIFGYTFRSDASNVLLLGAFAALGVFLIAVLLNGSFGKILKAIASSEVAAVAFGVDLPSFKIAAFVVSCTFLSLGGAVLAPRLKIIDPSSFGLMQSINALAYPVVGGMTSVWGGIAGGALLRALPEALRSFADYAELAFTALALLVILLLPRGLVGVIEDAARRAVRRDRAASPRDAAQSAGRAAAALNGHVGTTFVLERRPEQERDAGSPSGAALEAVGIRKAYGRLAAISGVSLTVEAGSIHGLIGPNGAGKTTLFNIVSGLAKADDGRLLLFGADVTAAPASRRIEMGVSRTFQHVATFDELSCTDNVVVGLGANHIVEALWGSFDDARRGARYRRRMELAEEALEVVGLFGRRNDRAGTLSLGDRRRLEVARAIASRPRLVLLDEPVSGVNREDERRLGELLCALNAGWNLTMLVIEHNVRFVADCCKRLTVMHDGAIITEGKPEDVIAMREVQQIYFGKA